MSDVVVGVDRSETAKRAAIRAAEVAAALGVGLHVLTCVDRAKPVDVAVGGDQFHTDWLSEADQFLADLIRELPHDSVTHSVENGNPARVLCEVAERRGAEMIVVGNRRVQGAGRMLGSVATDVLRHAPCDVLIANTTGG